MAPSSCAASTPTDPPLTRPTRNPSLPVAAGVVPAGLLWLCACAAPDRAAAPSPAVFPPAPAVEVAPAAPPRPLPRLSLPDGFGPEVLRPDPALGDEVVARVGESALRRSHAFGRLLTADPRLALSAVDLLVFDVLVAGHAEQFGIRVDPDAVRREAAQEAEDLRAQVRAELGEGLPFEDYVWRTFGMTLPDWLRTAEVRVAQRRYHGAVIRYLALREERVTVRYIVHQDPQVLAELQRKVTEGADFATLALRHSQDSLRRDGGLLPPFGRGFPHPVAEVAFGLQPGQMSPVTARDTQNGPRHFLVYCLDRRPGREVPYAEVREEIEQDLQRKPLGPIEINAYTLRWRGALDAPPPDVPPDVKETHDKGGSDR